MKFSEFKAEPKVEFEKIKKENPEKVESIEDELKKYENLSSEELMAEFIKESRKQRNSGELTDEKINNIKQTLKPFLNDAQQQKLNDLLGVIND